MIGCSEFAVNDAFAAMMAPLVGLTIPQAITALDRLREDLERARSHDRQQRPTLRIWGPRRTEREIEAREDAARAARLEQARRDEIVQWATARAAELRRAEHEATLPQREPDRTSRRQEVSHQGAEMTREWQDYIRQQLDRQERAMMKAIAQVVIEEERAREALGERVKALEAEVAELRDRETTRRLRAVPSTPPECNDRVMRWPSRSQPGKCTCSSRAGSAVSSH